MAIPTRSHSHISLWLALAISQTGKQTRQAGHLTSLLTKDTCPSGASCPIPVPRRRRWFLGNAWARARHPCLSTQLTTWDCPAPLLSTRDVLSSASFIQCLLQAKPWPPNPSLARSPSLGGKGFCKRGQSHIAQFAVKPSTSDTLGHHPLWGGELTHHGGELHTSMG